MTVLPARTIEATYENGLLRPLEPIHDFGNEVYLVMILNLDLFRAKKRTRSNTSCVGNIEVI